MAHNRILLEITDLDPFHDHQRIVYLSTCIEFPFDTTRALELALFRTFCSPSISRLLDQTGEFAERPQKRYDDTDLLISEILEWGYESDRGKEAIARMNAIHGRFEITNQDFLYVLSTFVFEPIRWNERFGWRKMCDNERLAMFYFWRQVGIRMHIRSIPETYEQFYQYSNEYEQEHFRFSETNHRVGIATRELFVGWGPWLLRPFVRSSIHALLDDSLVEAFGFPKPFWLTRQFVNGLLKARGYIAGWLPTRKKPRLRTSMTHPSHPHGYRISDLGPDGSKSPENETSSTLERKAQD